MIANSFKNGKKHAFLSQFQQIFRKFGVSATDRFWISTWRLIPNEYLHEIKY